MAAMFIIRVLDAGVEDDVVWFEYQTDAHAALNDMIDLHIEFEKRVPWIDEDNYTVFEYANGEKVLALVDPDYDKRG